MTRSEALKIIQQENLQHYSFFESGVHRESEIVIRINEGKYQVYVTSERAAIDRNSLKEFDEESEAIDKFIEILRDFNRFGFWGFW